MSRLSGKALEYDIANTIIDDSEPERAAKDKESRHKRKKEKRVEGKVENTKVISRSHSSLPLPGDTISSIPIETSTTKKPEGGFARPESSNHVDTHIGCSLDKAVPEVDDPDFISRPINLCIRQCDPDDSEETDFKQSLSRFRLSKPSPITQPPKNIDLPQKTTITVTTQDVMGTNAQKLPTLFCLSASLSKKQLANLNKCYVCDLAWTTRKTVPMKLTHIRSCAKKRGWSEETLVHVFKKELDVLDVPESSSSVPMVPPQEANSLLEDIVDKAAPRKKVKGSFSKGAILDPIQAHSAIVERAKTLFDPSNQSNEATDGFPSTQHFQPSKFSSISRGVFANAMLEENEKRVIPSTQKFEPSDLGRSLGSSSLNTVCCLDFNSIQPTSSLYSMSVAMPLTPTSENAEFLTTSETAVNKNSCRQVQLETTNKLDSQPTTLTIYSSHSSPSLSQSSVYYPLTKGTQEIINSKTMETNGTRPTDEIDIDERLRQIIKQNNVLNERILRYEPVHFDTFLSLDGIKEMNGRGFKHRLRVFLDKHSINFYTDSARETNRRRW